MKKILCFLPAIVWMMVIFSFSAAPANESSAVSDELSYKIVAAINATPFADWGEDELLNHAENLRVPIRKTAHFTEYVILALLWCFALGKCVDTDRKRLGMAFMICVLYAAGDEFHQLFVPGRDGNLKDVLIDSSGAVAGIFLDKTFFSKISPCSGAKNGEQT